MRRACLLKEFSTCFYKEIKGLLLTMFSCDFQNRKVSNSALYNISPKYGLHVFCASDLARFNIFKTCDKIRYIFSASYYECAGFFKYASLLT